MKQKAQIEPGRHREIINNGVDVPRQPPAFAIDLDEVGIGNKTVWITLPQGQIPFMAEMAVRLSSRARGIHMSRMEQAISSLHGQPFSQPDSYGAELIKEVVRQQKCECGFLELRGKLPVQRTALISNKPSIDPVDIHCRLTLDNGKLTSLLGVEVCHITACPCTQLYNDDLFPEEKGKCPMPTHSQRSRTMLMVEQQAGKPHWQNILACLEDSLHVTQDLLKRPDEAEIVLKAHQQPQFAEDAVRETARQAVRHFGARLPENSRIIINSRSLESIHIHDVTCRLSTSLAELARKRS